MKKFVSLVLSVVILATMLCVFAVPASAAKIVEWTGDKTLSGTKVFDDDISLMYTVVFGKDVMDDTVPCSVTVEEGASVTFNGSCRIDGGSTMTVKSGASVTFNGSCSVGNGTALTVESGASVICNGSLRLGTSGTVTVEKGASLTVNNALLGSNQTETSKVAVGGILKGKCDNIECDRLNIVLLPGGTIDVEISNQLWKESYLEYFKNLDKNATVKLTEDNYRHVTASVCDHDYTNTNGICTKCKYVNPELHKHDFKCACGMSCQHESEKTVGGEGSTLSEGNLAIITAVAGIVVGFLAAMFIFKKKKKPAVADGTENKGEE